MNGSANDWERRQQKHREAAEGVHVARDLPDLSAGCVPIRRGLPSVPGRLVVRRRLGARPAVRLRRDPLRGRRSLANRLQEAFTISASVTASLSTAARWFEDVVELLDVCYLEIHGNIDTRILSRRTNYVVCLIFETFHGSEGVASNGSYVSKSSVYLHQVIEVA
ncbi:F-box protein PP2-B1 [Apostasia shenzhenica]|uniref:F-box protein PP2-B1 n=1 Tax=Apostasia shenzhenica TaxID=1088818 RepID=A0A2I0ACX1_9ASPA|nr:F-box protein PP2-B1 [Apostasia shenzhenica]